EREPDLAPLHALVVVAAMDLVAGVGRWEASGIAQAAVALRDRGAREPLGGDLGIAIDRLTFASPARIRQPRREHGLSTGRHRVLWITRKLALRRTAVAILGIAVVTLLPRLKHAVSTVFARSGRVRIAQLRRSAGMRTGVGNATTSPTRAVVTEVAALLSLRTELYLALTRRITRAAPQALQITTLEIRRNTEALHQGHGLAVAVHVASPALVQACDVGCPDVIRAQNAFGPGILGPVIGAERRVPLAHLRLVTALSRRSRTAHRTERLQAVRRAVRAGSRTKLRDVAETFGRTAIDVRSEERVCGASDVAVAALFHVAKAGGGSADRAAVAPRVGTGALHP